LALHPHHLHFASDAIIGAAHEKKRGRRRKGGGGNTVRHRKNRIAFFILPAFGMKFAIQCQLYLQAFRMAVPRALRLPTRGVHLAASAELLDARTSAGDV